MPCRLIVSAAAMAVCSVLCALIFQSFQFQRMERLNPRQEVNSNRYARCTSRPQRHAYRIACSAQVNAQGGVYGLTFIHLGICAECVRARSMFRRICSHPVCCMYIIPRTCVASISFNTLLVLSALHRVRT